MLEKNIVPGKNIGLNKREWLTDANKSLRKNQEVKVNGSKVFGITKQQNINGELMINIAYFPFLDDDEPAVDNFLPFSFC